MANIWVHSDWHWQHENIYKFTYTRDGVERRVREKFLDSKEGDQYIAQRWRDLVKAEDHVWVLGDVCMERGNNRAGEFIALMKSLPGHKRLILGNHDHLKTSIYMKAGFEKIRGSNMLDGVLMTHYPVHPSSISYKVKANAHGHIHQNDSPDGQYINCCVEVNEYSPIPFDEILTKAKKLKEQYGN